MQVFVSEYVCGGAWPALDVPPSLLREAAAMWRALLDDFARIRGCRVVATFDRRLPESVTAVDSPGPHTALERIGVEGPDEERDLFARLAARADATLVVAPEFDGILSSRRRLVDRVGGRYLGPATAAIALCTDKLASCRHLRRHDVPTIPTESLDSDRTPAPFELPVVVKPRDGAGSLDTFLVRNREEFARAAGLLAESRREGIVQPFVSGRSVSVAVLAGPSDDRLDVLPPAHQRLSTDGRFEYRGGEIPAEGVDCRRLEETVRRACATLPGLRGYIGLDLLIPDHDHRTPLVVEINPRLTTSYVGYRSLTHENLAVRMLGLKPPLRAIAWNAGVVRFRADGALLEAPADSLVTGSEDSP